MANPRPIYRRRPVPALGDVAAAQIDEELRRIEDWSLSIDYLVSGRPEATFDCPADDGKLIYYDCSNRSDKPAPLKYDPAYPLNPGFDSFISDADFIFPYDRAIAFQDSANAALIGGIGNIPVAPDVLLVVGTADINQWDNVATRRPLFMGGSAVVFDAGTSLQMLLPGVTANSFGYDLQLSTDGRTALAVPLPQPDFTATDTSNDDGTTLISGTGLTPWTIFPDDSDTQPDKLEVTIPDPQEPGDVIMRVKIRVLNTTSNRTGTITIGVGADGATPLPDDQQTFIVPAAFSGALDLAVAFTFAETTTAPVVMTVWYQGSGDHNQFNLETDNAEGEHQLEVSISRGGGGTQPPITDHQLLNNRFVANTHDAPSIAWDSTGTEIITASTVNGALFATDSALETQRDQIAALQASKPRGWGGWAKASDSKSLGVVGNTPVRVSANAANDLSNNTNITFSPDLGWIFPNEVPARRVMLHAHITISVSVETRVRLQFEAGGISPIAGTTERTCYIGDLNDLHLSVPAPVVQDVCYALVRTVGGAATITFNAGTFWMEYE